MEEQAYIGELISALIYLYVGMRLLRLSSRSGEVPERILGAMFLVVGDSATSPDEIFSRLAGR